MALVALDWLRGWRRADEAGGGCETAMAQIILESDCGGNTARPSLVTRYSWLISVAGSRCPSVAADQSSDDSACGSNSPSLWATTAKTSSIQALLGSTDMVASAHKLLARAWGLARPVHEKTEEEGVAPVGG